MHEGYEIRGKKLDEFEIGKAYYTPSRTICESEIINFACMTWDINQVHVDEEFAQQTCGGRIVHGAMTLSYTLGLVTALGIWDGTALANLHCEVDFTGMVRPGDTITCRFTVTDKRRTSKGDRGIISYTIETLNQRNEVVMKYIGKGMVKA